jgi:hypothetical protein
VTPRTVLSAAAVAGLLALPITLAADRVSADPAPLAKPTKPVKAAKKAVTRDLRFTLDHQPRGLTTIALPKLKKGAYAITWSAYLDGATGSVDRPLKGECYLRQKKNGQDVLFTADDSTLSVGDSMSVSGSGVIDTRQGSEVALECELTDGTTAGVVRTWGTYATEPIQVTITPVAAYARSNRTH